VLLLFVAGGFLYREVGCLARISRKGMGTGSFTVIYTKAPLWAFQAITLPPRQYIVLTRALWRDRKTESVA
jgi:hypothetical protein